ncbi:MAG: c-type cytochrome [Anaerolineae bacterium]
MSVQPSSVPEVQGQRASPMARLRWPLIAVAAVIALVWLVPARLPADSGWRLGLPFRMFYTGIAILGGLFFLLLEAPAPRRPTSGLGVVVGISAVYLATVGFLVGIGMIFPQFQIPAEQVAVAESPAERGQALFLDSATTCILCHAIEGQGGTRGPDLSGVATRAGTRVAGLSAEEYIRQSILDPTAFVVEGYDPIMPPGLIKVIGEENLDDLVAFLLTLE